MRRFHTKYTLFATQVTVKRSLFFSFQDNRRSPHIKTHTMRFTSLSKDMVEQVNTPVAQFNALYAQMITAAISLSHSSVSEHHNQSSKGQLTGILPLLKEYTVQQHYLGTYLGNNLISISISIYTQIQILSHQSVHSVTFSSSWWQWLVWQSSQYKLVSISKPLNRLRLSSSCLLANVSFSLSA